MFNTLLNTLLNKKETENSNLLITSKDFIGNIKETLSISLNDSIKRKLNKLDKIILGKYNFTKYEGSSMSFMDSIYFGGNSDNLIYDTYLTPEILNSKLFNKFMEFSYRNSSRIEIITLKSVILNDFKIYILEGKKIDDYIFSVSDIIIEYKQLLEIMSNEISKDEL